MLCQNKFINTMIANSKAKNECHEGQSQGSAAAGGEAPSEFEMAHAQEDYENLQKIFED